MCPVRQCAKIGFLSPALNNGRFGQIAQVSVVPFLNLVYQTGRTLKKGVAVLSRRKKETLPEGLRYDDLPTWMRRTHREVDWAFLVMALVVLMSAWPFGAQAGLPLTPAMRALMARTVEMAESIQAGVLYPRWASDFNYGYGAPLWNYLAPLPHYLTGLYRVLAQASTEHSVKAIFALALLLNGLAMFSFVRRRWGTYAAILAATTYVYSPQLVQSVPYLQGDLALLFALGMWWLALWALDRVLVLGRGEDVGGAVLSVAALWLTHAPLNVVLVLLAGAWLAWQRWARRSSPYWGRAVAALGLGTGLSAFYWLPAWLEWGAVRWWSASNYPLDAWPPITLGALLGGAQRLTLNAVNPPPTAALGWAVWGGAVLAGGVLWRWLWKQTPLPPHAMPRGEALQWRLERMARLLPSALREALFFGVLALGLGVAVSWPSLPLWERSTAWSPLRPFMLLPLIVGSAAVVGGQLGWLLEGSQRRGWAAVAMGGAVALVLVLALPSLVVPTWPTHSTTENVLDVLSDELRGHMVASLTDGWLLPQTAPQLPPPDPALVASYQSGVVNRVAREALPAAARVDVIQHGPQSERLAVSTPYSVDVPLRLLAFPHWRAQIKGAPIPVRIVSETGLVTLVVPSGQHEVTVRLAPSRVREVGWLVSGAALVGALLFVLHVLYRQDEALAPSRWRAPIWQPPRELVPYHHAVCLVLALCFGVGGLWPRLASEHFAQRMPPGVVPQATPLPRALQGGVDLLAYTLEPRDTLRPGDFLTVELYWRAVRPDLPDYQVRLALVPRNAPENPLLVEYHRHPGQLPSSLWARWPLFEAYVRDTYVLRLPAEAAVGEYQVVVQMERCTRTDLFPCEEGEPLFVRDPYGSRLGQQIVLPQVLWVLR